MSHKFSVAAWYGAISSRDPERLRPFLHPQARYEDVPTGTVSEGVEAVLAFFRGVWTAIPDMTMEPTGAIDTPNAVAAEWFAAGTHLGDFPGLPATGNAFRVRGASIIEVAGGRAKRVADYWDLATSGLLLPPAQGEATD